MTERTNYYLLFLLSGALFVAVGVSFNLAGYGRILYPLLLNIGATVISVICVKYLWEKSGGEPVLESLDILKRLSHLVDDSAETGLRRLYASRRDIEYDELNEQISKAQDVAIMSLVLKIQHSFRLKDSIIRCIKGGGHIRILVSDPSSDSPELNPLKLRQYAQKDLEHNAMPAEIMSTLDFLRDTRSELSKEAGDLDKRLQYKTLPSNVMYFSLMAIDDTMVVTSYCNKRRGQDCPTMLIDKTSSARSLYVHYKGEFEHLWRRGRSPDEAPGEDKVTD